MIKFFRHIRKSLINENKMGKYFKYAIGEIILVVIGILIALQINNMREQSIERDKELAYLKEINLDFKSNKQQLDSIIEHNLTSLHAIKRLQIFIASLKKDESIYTTIQNHPLLDSLMYYQQKSFANKSFNPKNGSIRALINSSSFDVIKNDSLRRLLISWNDVLGDYLEEEQFAMNFLFNEYYPFIRKNYNYSNLFDPKNMEIWFSNQEYNYRETRKGDLGNMLQTVQEEGIVSMINDIIRLRETAVNQ